MAASKSGIRIDGLEELSDFLTDTLPREANNLLRQTNRAVATEVKKEMQSRAPRRTGTLRKSIFVKQNRARGNAISADVRIKTGHDEGAKKTGAGRTGYGDDGFYWRFLEYGTVNMPAQPFRTPSVEAIKPRLPALFRQHFGKKLERLKAKKASSV